LEGERRRAVGKLERVSARGSLQVGAREPERVKDKLGHMGAREQRQFGAREREGVKAIWSA
jgi:hypothetical protein